jgi:hypothetical protein
MKEMSDIILNLLSEDVDLEVKMAAGKDVWSCSVFRKKKSTNFK